VATLAVTSASVGEGKTSIATNLALAFSRAGHRVAIVDADMRRPRVATVLELPDAPGLSDVLGGKISLEDALVYTDEGRLAVLTSGPIPANPSEALGSGMMEQVLARLGDMFEYVIVDTPPVLPVTDALVVAPMVDGVVLVTRLGRTTREQVRRAMAGVRRVNAELIGIVSNHAGKGTDRYYRYGYKYSASLKQGETPEEIDTDVLKPSIHPHGAAAGGSLPDTLPAHAVQSRPREYEPAHYEPTHYEAPRADAPASSPAYGVPPGYVVIPGQGVAEDPSAALTAPENGSGVPSDQAQDSAS
jgi:capsular exopolysaccharide synthesis family protein